MAVIVNFCSVFSIRLGSIIVATLCLIQAAAVEVVCILGLQDVRGVSQNLNDFMAEKDLLFLTGFLNDVKKNPEPYLLTTLVVFIVYSCSCILLIYGALKLNVWLVVPFVGLELLRLCTSLAVLVASMLVVKKNSMDLSPIMGGSTGGGFFMLLMLYMWTCPLSLAQELLQRARETRTTRSKRAVAPGHVSAFNDVNAVDRTAFEVKLTQHAARLSQYPFTMPYPAYRGYPKYIN